MSSKGHVVDLRMPALLRRPDTSVNCGLCRAGINGKRMQQLKFYIFESFVEVLYARTHSRNKALELSGPGRNHLD